MNAQKKGSGLKNLYLLIKKPAYEKNLTKLVNIIGRDMESMQMRKYYLTKQCMKWMLLIGNKLILNKKKKMKVAFVNFSVSTPLTKEISAVTKVLQEALKSS